MLITNSRVVSRFSYTLQRPLHWTSLCFVFFGHDLSFIFFLSIHPQLPLIVRDTTARLSDCQSQLTSLSLKRDAVSKRLDIFKQQLEEKQQELQSYLRKSERTKPAAKSSVDGAKAGAKTARKASVADTKKKQPKKK